MHALLFRKWKQRVKGRDWYDLEWYIRKGVPLHLQHLLLRAQDTGDWTEPTIKKEQLVELLKTRINNVSFEAIREDIRRFVRDERVLEIWSPQYFNDLADRLRVKN
jgi:hypothetical protein